MQVLTKFSFGMKNVDSFLVKLMMKIVIQKVMLIRKYVKICTSQLVILLSCILYMSGSIYVVNLLFMKIFLHLYIMKRHIPETYVFKFHVALM